MITFLVALVFLAVALLLIVMRKTYHFLPAKELKRRAATTDPESALLYQAVAYGEGLEIVLWFLIAVCAAVGFVLFSRVAPVWFSLIAVIMLLVVFYEVVPGSRVSPFSRRLTVLCSPTLIWIVKTFYPLLRRAPDVQHRYSARSHTNIYDRNDVIELFQKQLSQADSRLSETEIKTAAQTLSFHDLAVHSLTLRWNKVKTIDANDTVGPIIIDELHSSGQALIPVTESHAERTTIVGMLRVATLGIRSEGKAGELMDQAVYYIHEDDSLIEALHAFCATNQPVLVVVDAHANYIGILSIGTLLKQLIGDLPGEDSDIYTDLSEITKRHREAADDENRAAENEEREENSPATEKTVVE